MLTSIRIVVLVLAGLHLTATLLVALVANFADGGDILSRILLTVVHPACAAALIAVVATPQGSDRFALTVTCLLALNIVADSVAAVAIAADLIMGDWWLPLTFSVVPAVGIAYVVATARLRPRSQ